jgi:hypothetical protein
VPNPEELTSLTSEPSTSEAFKINSQEIFSDRFILPVPDPTDLNITEPDFLEAVDQAWHVCDRFDLQTDIWRGKILRVVRDREKEQGEVRGTGFLRWLQDREISKSQAYNWITLADSSDILTEDGKLLPEDVSQFSKRAFLETAQASSEVQELVVEAAKNGDRITRREVRQLSDQWTVMNSDLLTEDVKEKVAEQTIPCRYVAPLVREITKLPEAYQGALKQAIADAPDLDNIRQVTAEAQRLSKYLLNSDQVQALTAKSIDVDMVLEEALRLGALKITADLVGQASQLEQAIAKLWLTWKKVKTLADQVYVESGASTPHLRSLLEALEPLTHDLLELELGGEEATRTISIHISEA